MKKIIFIIIGVFTAAFLFLNYCNESEFGISDVFNMGRLDKLENYFSDTDLTKVNTVELNNGKAVYYMDCRKGKPPHLWEFLLLISDKDDKVCAVMGTCYPNAFGVRTTVISRFLAKYWYDICENPPNFILFVPPSNAPEGTPPLQVAKHEDSPIHGEWTRIPSVSENIILITKRGEELLIDLKKKEPEKFKKRHKSNIPFV